MTVKRLRRVCKIFLLLVDNALYWISCSPVDSAVSFVNSYRFEQLDPDVLFFFKVRMVLQ